MIARRGGTRLNSPAPELLATVDDVQAGTYKVTFATGAPCASGTHRYRTASFGWDGPPTSYPGKNSAWVNITC